MKTGVVIAERRDVVCMTYRMQLLVAVTVQYNDHIKITPLDLRMADAQQLTLGSMCICDIPAGMHA